MAERITRWLESHLTERGARWAYRFVTALYYLTGAVLAALTLSLAVRCGRGEDVALHQAVAVLLLLVTYREARRG